MQAAAGRPLIARARAKLAEGAFAARTAVGAGLVAPRRPDRALRALVAMRQWGLTAAAAYKASAALYPDAVALIDECGELTFAQVNERADRLACALCAAGLDEGDALAIMCRNHRYFVDATVACAKLGADALFLNTAFGGPQLNEVLRRERPAALVYDDEFAPLLDGDVAERRFVAWHDRPRLAHPTLDELIAAQRPRPLRPPRRTGRIVVLTSGTTGAPKGASRKQPEALGPALALLSKIPLRARGRTFIVAPLFHAAGFAHMELAMLLSSTVILRRRFDPVETLSTIARHRPDCAAMVPIMLQRIMELPRDLRSRYDTSSLRTLPLSGSALPAGLALDAMNELGDVVYNLYGSTEVAWATIATPRDLRAAPGTAGSAPHGTTVKVCDERGHPCPTGESGRIFVANELLFEGYTGGGEGRETLDGLVATGDVGHLDAEGRLFVSGRDDEMIVSGGENVFPREVEDLIAGMDGVVEAAVVGVPDGEFGQRLKAFVVRDGASPTADEVKRHVKRSLARYKAPRDVAFVRELPRNATGKVIKRALAASAR